jgi:hypothetical protein
MKKIKKKKEGKKYFFKGTMGNVNVAIGKFSSFSFLLNWRFFFFLVQPEIKNAGIIAAKICKIFYITYTV